MLPRPVTTMLLGELKAFEEITTLSAELAAAGVYVTVIVHVAPGASVDAQSCLTVNSLDVLRIEVSSKLALPLLPKVIERAIEVVPIVTRPKPSEGWDSVSVGAGEAMPAPVRLIVAVPIGALVASASVALRAPSALGCNAAVTVQVPCLVYCASNGFGGMGGGGNMPSPFWMTSVSVSNAQPAYTNASGNAPGGYFNYIGLPIALAASRTMNLTVVTNFPVAHRTSVWVDLNVNGMFDANELVANGLTNAGVNAGTFTATFTLPAPTAGLSTRMRVQVAANMNPPAACGVNILNAEVEDYQVIIGPLAAREALALPSLSLYPTPTLDGHVRLHLPDAAAAGLYGATVQNVLGATLLTTRLRLGPANDAELDLSALAPGVYVLKLRDAQGQTALRRVVRE